MWQEKEETMKIVTNFPEAAAMGRILMNVGFPANKNKILQFVQKHQESNPECRFDCKEILPLLQKIEERHYENTFEVTKCGRTCSPCQIDTSPNKDKGRVKAIPPSAVRRRHLTSDMYFVVLRLVPICHYFCSSIALNIS